MKHIHIVSHVKRNSAKTIRDIAAALRKDTSDFACIDEIIDLVEVWGVDTLPRHDFG